MQKITIECPITRKRASSISPTQDGIPDLLPAEDAPHPPGWGSLQVRICTSVKDLATRQREKLAQALGAMEADPQVPAEEKDQARAVLAQTDQGLATLEDRKVWVEWTFEALSDEAMAAIQKGLSEAGVLLSDLTDETVMAFLASGIGVTGEEEEED